MIWWVYQQVLKVRGIYIVFVATDYEQIARACQSIDINCFISRSDNASSTELVNEVASRIESDLYICVHGDEPLIDLKVIERIIPETKPKETPYVAKIMTRIKSAAGIRIND